MAIIVGIPLLAILAILQSTILSQLRLLDGRPDLVLLALVGWGMTGRWRESMIWGFIGGLFLDLLSGMPFGATAVLLVLVGAMVSFWFGRFWEAHFLLPLGVTLAASLLLHGLSLAALVLIGHEIDPLTAVARVVLPSTFLNLLLAIPASELASSLSQALFPPQVRA